jgi:hypothetical protein
MSPWPFDMLKVTSRSVIVMLSFVEAWARRALRLSPESVLLALEYRPRMTFSVREASVDAKNLTRYVVGLRQAEQHDASRGLVRCARAAEGDLAA